MTFLKSFACPFFIIALASMTLLTSFVNTNSVSISNLGNSSYIDFSPGIVSYNTPNFAVLNNKNLTCYWNLNEGAGKVILDSTHNGNNGTFSASTSWTDGKYGYACYLNGSSNNYIISNVSLSVNNAGSMCVWIKPDGSPANWAHIAGWYDPGLYIQANTKYPYFQMRVNSSTIATVASSPILPDVWQFLVATWYYNSSLNQTKISVYLNGVLAGSQIVSGVPINVTRPILVGSNTDVNIKGSLDDFRLYNRELTPNEVLAIYEESYPLSYANYSCFSDSEINNTLLINIDNLSVNANNSVLLTCTNFFANNKLDFQANDSVVVNLWTNLQCPISISNGVWNSANYTITLLLNASSSGEVDWNRVPPSASNVSTSTVLAGNTTVFSVMWNDTKSLSGGGFIFSTNNTGKWVNYTWAPFTFTPDWGNATLVLNKTVGLTVGFREYANNSLGTWYGSEIYVIKTTAVNIPQETPAITPTPTPSTTPVPSSSLTTNPTPTGNPTLTSTPTPNPTPNTLNLVEIVIISLLLLAAVFAVAFKRGNIHIEIAGEDIPEESSDDYTI